MTGVILFGDTYCSGDVRHAIPLSLPDPVLYVEHGDSRHVVADPMEIPMLETLAGVTPHTFAEFDTDSRERSKSEALADRLELAALAVVTLGVRDALVPGSFPLQLADMLRERGVTVTVEDTVFSSRRRRKSPAEVAGVKRAQRAAEAGLEAAVELLYAAEQLGGQELIADGAPVTAERLKRVIAAVVAAHGASCTDMIVSHGPQTAIGHDMGSGVIRKGEPIIIDIWPRDSESGCYADLTRSLVVGDVSTPFNHWHETVREVLDRVLALIRPGIGVAEVYESACSFFEEAGYATRRIRQSGDARKPSFRGLGHGVGLSVHEPPVLEPRSDLQIERGDVLAVEPGLYDPELGGMRLEDLVVVTSDGCEVITESSYELRPSARVR